MGTPSVAPEAAPLARAFLAGIAQKIQNNRQTNLADTMTPVQRSRCMSRIRSRDTKPELTLRRALFGRGLRFRVKSGLKGKPDIVLTKVKIAIFVDGCFWHGCPVHGTSPKSNSAYWSEKLARNRARDAEVAATLSAQGWHVIRYWDHDVRGDLNRVAQEIEALWRAKGARPAR